jgi:hypothetical protein
MSANHSLSTYSRQKEHVSTPGCLLRTRTSFFASYEQTTPYRKKAGLIWYSFSGKSAQFITPFTQVLPRSVLCAVHTTVCRTYGFMWCNQAQCLNTPVVWDKMCEVKLHFGHSSTTPITVCPTVQFHIPEDCSIQQHCYQNLKSCKVSLSLHHKFELISHMNQHTFNLYSTCTLHVVTLFAFTPVCVLHTDC